MSKVKLCAIFMALASPLPLFAQSSSLENSTTRGKASIKDLRQGTYSTQPLADLCHDYAVGTAYFKAEGNAEARATIIKEPKIGNSILAIIASKLDESKEDDRNLLTNLYRRYDRSSDIPFNAWEINRRIKLFEILAADPLLNSVRQHNWDKLTLEDKRALAAHINRLQATVYNSSITPILLVDEVDEDGGYDEAYFLDSEKTISLNTYMSKTDKDKRTFMYGDFETFVSIVVHEGDHAFVLGLGHSIAIPPSLRSMANIASMTNTDNNYLSARVSGYEAYQLNPIEVNAASIETDVLKFLKADKIGRAAQLAELHKMQISYRQRETALRKELGRENPNATCQSLNLN